MSWQDDYYQQQIEKGKYIVFSGQAKFGKQYKPMTFEERKRDWRKVKVANTPDGKGVWELQKVEKATDRPKSDNQLLNELARGEITLETYEAEMSKKAQATRDTLQSEKGTSFDRLLDSVHEGKITFEEMKKIQHEKAQSWRFKKDEEKKATGGLVVSVGGF